MLMLNLFGLSGLINDPGILILINIFEIHIILLNFQLFTS